MSSTITKPKVSIIIPSWTGEISCVMQGIEQQTFHNYEIIVVQGVSPAARARNEGVQRAKADILLFIDDDASLGHEHVFEMMVNLLENDVHTAVVGISQQVPANTTQFQHAIAKQLPRISYPISSDNLVSNPPLDSYGFTAITTLCCVVRRTVFEEVGGFDEELLSGEDTDFFYCVRQQDYNLVVAANCWVYHAPPSDMKALLRKSFWYGMGHALETRKNPERHMAVLPLNRWYSPLGLIAAAVSFPLAFFVHYYFDVHRFAFGFRPLKTLSAYVSLCGYVYGWYHGKPRNAVAILRSGNLENAEVQTR